MPSPPMARVDKDTDEFSQIIARKVGLRDEARNDCESVVHVDCRESNN